jgi:hypothetical protein
MQKLPDEIGSIIHLRYLGIRNSNLEDWKHNPDSSESST